VPTVAFLEAELSSRREGGDRDGER